MPELTLAVVGIKFRGAAAIECCKRAPVGYVARLEREQHPSDLNAVQVHILGRQVGYLPKLHNAELAAAMDKGATPTAIVTREIATAKGRITKEPLLTVSW